MKKIFVCAFAFMQLSVITSAQEIRDKIVSSLDDMQQAVQQYERIPSLKQWMNENNIPQRIANNHILFSWPMRVNSNYDDIPNYYRITNYVDQNWNNGVKDEWHCSARTYNGHEGLDIITYPFFWRMKDNSNVFASAGAPGIVTAVRDNLEDDNCILDGRAGNYVEVLHSDSSLARYYHIKTGSARVSVNEFIKEGQLIALIASSGNTSNPHLHFDVRDKDGSWIEPFYSSNPDFECNTRNESSWWQNQKPYREPQINRVMTHSGTPQIFGYINSVRNDDYCKVFEDAKAKNQFSPGNPVTIGVALYDVHPDDSIFVSVRYPDNSIYTEYRQGLFNLDNLVRIGGMYRTRSFTLPSNAPEGTYTVTVDFEYRSYTESTTTLLLTKTYKHFFTVGCQPDKSLSGNVTDINGHIVSNSINSTQLINGGRTTYQSANYVQLNPGFRASAGTTFKAKIRSCGNVE